MDLRYGDIIGYRGDTYKVIEQTGHRLIVESLDSEKGMRVRSIDLKGGGALEVRQENKQDIQIIERRFFDPEGVNLRG